MEGGGWIFTAETQRTRRIVGGWLLVNVKVKESWETEDPVRVAPAERGPTELRECGCEREGERKLQAKVGRPR